MKIAITGHTRGIGKAIVENLKGNEIIGLSSSNGYDIADIDKIVSMAKDADIFINNAYKDYYQKDLLLAFYELWKDTNKMIISIGSIVTDYPRIERELDSQPWPYRDHKRALRDTFRTLIKQPHNCRMALVNPGATDTDMIKHHNVAKMNPVEVARAVRYVMYNSFVKELIVYEK
jgi:NAD(P)-dependent dehydrogenase (short-subunit alcohol dehydrogenase family)